MSFGANHRHTRHRRPRTSVFSIEYVYTECIGPEIAAVQAELLLIAVVTIDSFRTITGGLPVPPNLTIPIAPETAANVF